MSAPADEEAGDVRSVEDRRTAEPTPPEGGRVEPAAVELWEVSEQLLMAGLREHALADQLRRQFAFSSAVMSSLAEGCTRSTVQAGSPLSILPRSSCSAGGKLT